jgi:hypothetical protein
MSPEDAEDWGWTVSYIGSTDEAHTGSTGGKRWTADENGKGVLLDVITKDIGFKTFIDIGEGVQVTMLYSY